jgi:putative membrane protein
MPAPALSITGQSLPTSWRQAILALSWLIPIVVALLLAVPNKLVLGEWTKSLPHLIGAINSITAMFLVAALVAIRQRRIVLHRRLMTAAVTLGAAFLVCYVTYHISNPPTRFGGQGATRTLYYVVLGTHVLGSIAVLPLVLRSYAYAWLGEMGLHRKLVRFAWPLWFFVSVSGVIAYKMITPYRNAPVHVAE